MVFNIKTLILPVVIINQISLRKYSEKISIIFPIVYWIYIFLISPVSNRLLNLHILNLSCVYLSSFSAPVTSRAPFSFHPNGFGWYLFFMTLVIPIQPFPPIFSSQKNQTCHWTHSRTRITLNHFLLLCHFSASFVTHHVSFCVNLLLTLPILPNVSQFSENL